MYKIQMDVLLNFIKRQLVLIVVIALIGGAALTFVTSSQKDSVPVFSSTSVIFVSDYRVDSAEKRFNYSVSEGSIYQACRSYIEEPSFAQKVAHELNVDPETIKVSTPRIKNELNESVSTPLILVQVSAADKDLALKGNQIATNMALDTYRDLMKLNRVEVVTQPTLDTKEPPLAAQSGFSPKKFILWTAILVVLLGAIAFVRTVVSRKISVASDVYTKLGVDPSGYVRAKDCSQEAPRERLLAAQIKALMNEDQPQRPAVVTLTTADMEDTQFATLVQELKDRVDAAQSVTLTTLHGVNNKLQALDTLDVCDALYVVVVANKASSAQVVAAHETLGVLGKNPTRVLFCE